MNLYPVLATADPAASADFYRRHFGFETVFETDWYVSLKHPDGPEIALLDLAHETIPAAHRGTAAAGVLVNIEVPDVDAVAARLLEAGVSVIQPLRSEAFGQRHVIVADPGGVLVDVITEIEPDPEFAASFGI